MQIIVGIMYTLSIVYALGSLSNPHNVSESYLYSFIIVGCSLGLLAQIRDQIIDELRNK